MYVLKNQKNKNKKVMRPILDSLPQNIKSNKISRTATQNFPKSVDEKINQIKDTLEKYEIDILITQEWAGWKHEEGIAKQAVPGYTNFVSFVTNTGRQRENVSELAMTYKQSKRYKEKNSQKRKKGTTILVKNNMINKCNVNEIQIQKNGMIVAIEMTIEEEKKVAIIGIHAEPEQGKAKKEAYFKKIRKHTR